MANIHDIRLRINGIRQTRQTTNAMYLVSTSRMRKAMHGIEQNRAYFYHALDAMKDIRARTNIDHPYLTHRGGNRVAYIVVAGEKGLSGSYNHDILNFALDIVGKSNVALIYTVGAMATNALKRLNYDVRANFSQIGEAPGVSATRRMVTNILDMYDAGEIDELRILFTHFTNSMAYTPRDMKLLPLELDSFGIGREPIFEEMFYDPSPNEVFTSLVPQFIIGYVYGALVHAYASENCARMAAMESATKSADEMLEKLTRQYHSARQLAITNEISEIVGAADAFLEQSEETRG